MRPGGATPLRLGAVPTGVSAALVADDGTLAWWCPGRFDADPACASLLDARAAAVRTAPPDAIVRGRQRYLDGTNVLSTVLEWGECEVELLDVALPPAGQRLARVVHARRGPARVAVSVAPATGFARTRAVHTWSEGVATDEVWVHTGATGCGPVSEVVVPAGARHVVTVGLGAGRAAASTGEVLDHLERAVDDGRRRLSTVEHDGPYRWWVDRSVLALDALTHRVTGGIVRAATASLPYAPGGERNWDERYVWLADAAAAAHALVELGLRERSSTLLAWLAGAIADHGATVPPVLAVDGAPPPGERELPGVEGWGGAQPVRLGTAEQEQRQPALWASLVRAAVAAAKHGDDQLRKLLPDLRDVADRLCDTWSSPDHGVWGLRRQPHQLTSSKLAVRYALARLVDVVRADHPLDLDAVAWRETAREIEAWLAANATAGDRGLRLDPSGADLADAALLHASWQLDGDHALLTRTVDRTLRRLGDGPFVRRLDRTFDDGFAPEDSASVPASFWAVEALARLGRWDEAHERMEALCGFARPLGLLPAGAEPASGTFTGNVPYAPSHVALLHAALALAAGPS